MTARNRTKSRFRVSRQTDRRLVEPRYKAKVCILSTGSVFSPQLVVLLSAYPTPKNSQPDSFIVAVRGPAVWRLAIFLFAFDKERRVSGLECGHP